MEEDPDNILATLTRLVAEHRQLDGEIATLQERPFADQLLLQRLKKRKLWLKDTIVRLESRLSPDLDA
ncbi:MAG: YdcH family protein [Pseudomonadales bacterium]|nr:YdcH family protein [Pseudomonadales bacterium]